MKPGAPLLQSGRLVDQVRKRIGRLHYSLKTEKASSSAMPTKATQTCKC